MLLIDDKVVSLDIIENFFCCNLDKCLGSCCIEGDAGAPITAAEEEEIKKALPAVMEYLSRGAREVIEEQGISYRDPEGELVTSIVNGADCVFTTYAPGGKCLCALEKAWREGKTSFMKPLSCHLYPIRLTHYPSFTALNYHRWKICKCAEVEGRAKNIRIYQALKEPLIRAFGKNGTMSFVSPQRNICAKRNKSKPLRSHGSMASNLKTCRLC